MIKLDRIFIIAVLIILISSCQPLLKIAFNIHNTSFYTSRNDVDEINKKNLARFDINYIMLYRTNKYINNTGDTLKYSGKISFYNELGKEYTNSGYCSKVNYKSIDSKALKTSSYQIYNTLNIQARLVSLEYISGEPFQFNYNINCIYWVVMDWNIFWRGPEKKRLKKF